MISDIVDDIVPKYQEFDAFLENSRNKPEFTLNIIQVFFHKKLRIYTYFLLGTSASTESYLKLSKLEYSEFLTSFLKVP